MFQHILDSTVCTTDKSYLMEEKKSFRTTHTIFFKDVLPKLNYCLFICKAGL